jgi:hypothetical protein
MKTCPRCGVENKPERAACWNCWAPLEGATGAAAAPRPTGRGLSLAVPWTAVAVVLLVLVAAAVAYFFFLSSKPAQVAEQYLHAVRNGNQAKAERLSSAETKTDKLLPDAILVSDYQVQREGVSVEGKQATVPATVHLTVDPIVIGLERAVMADAIMKFLQSHPVSGDIYMVRQGINWRVDQAQTRQQFTQAIMRGLPPGLATQLAGLVMGGRARPQTLPAAGVTGGKAAGLQPTPPTGQPPAGASGGFRRTAPAAAPGASPPAGGAKASSPAGSAKAAPEDETGGGGLRRTLPSDTGEDD